MREIKFRAWVKEDVKSLEGIMVYPGDKSDFVMISNGDEFEVLFDFEGAIYKDTYHIMQFSGLTDKNGKEIYEGDVIYIAGFGDYHVEFPFQELYDRVFSGDGDDIGEIKGNIYKNPELLK